MTSLTTPSSVGIMTNHNWLGLNGTYDSIMPVIDRTEYQVYGSQRMRGLIEEILGGVNFIKGISYRHASADRYNQPVIAAYVSGSTNSPNDTVLYLMDSSDTIAGFPASAVEPYVATGATVTLMPVRLRDTLIFPGGAQGYVTDCYNENGSALTAGQFKAVATNGIALPQVTNADIIINTGVTNGERGSSPSSKNFRDGWYYNMCEIMADMFESTGSALADATWIEYEFNGKTENKWWFKGQNAATIQFDNYMEMKWMTGNRVVSATAIDAFDPTVTRTEGLYPFASSYNALQVFNITAGLSLQDFEGYITDSIDRNNGTVEYTLLNSIYNDNAISRFIRSEMRQGGITYNTFAPSAAKNKMTAKEQCVNFGFNAFTHSGYSFYQMVHKPFNDPTTLGADGHVYKNSTIFIPMNQEIYGMGEMKEKTNVPSMRINYSKNGDTNRKYEKFLLGGTNGVYTNSTDSIQINFRTQCGFEGIGENRFLVLQGTNS